MAFRKKTFFLKKREVVLHVCKYFHTKQGDSSTNDPSFNKYLLSTCYALLTILGLYIYKTINKYACIYIFYFGEGRLEFCVENMKFEIFVKHSNRDIQETTRQDHIT